MKYAPHVTIGLLIIFLFSVIVAAHNADSRWAEKRNTFKAHCIDAGGYPVTPWDYVKDHGDGYLCINSSAIIQLKDETNAPK